MAQTERTEKRKKLPAVLGLIASVVFLCCVLWIFVLPMLLPKDVLGVRWGLSSDQVIRIKKHTGIHTGAAGAGLYDLTLFFEESVYERTGRVGYNFDNGKLVGVTYHFETESDAEYEEALGDFKESLNGDYGESAERESASGDGQVLLHWENDRTQIKLDTGTSVKSDAGKPPYSVQYISIYFTPREEPAV